jgi:dTDP-4-amino-4,6-dideoxygalactose transaminase
MINFLDIKHQYDELRDSLDAAAKAVFCDGLYIGGDYLSEFEKNFASYVGADHCFGVGNGLDTLSLLVGAADLPVRSKVIIPNNTFIATALAVFNEGLTVINKNWGNRGCRKLEGDNAD